MSEERLVTTEQEFLALLEAGVQLRSTPEGNELRAEHILWAWDNDEEWKHKCRTFWIPRGYYFVEVE